MVVQHGEKRKEPGDPGLTDAGRAQAATVAAFLRATTDVVAVVTSPMRRAVETGRPIASATGTEATTDERLRERMNWDGGESIEDFIDDWGRASADRSYRPRSGDSSLDAAVRFLDALDEIAATYPNGTVAVVSHGGVTTDALRTVLGDRELTRRSPALMSEGMPSGALTIFRRVAESWSVDAIASTAHLESASAHRLV